MLRHALLALMLLASAGCSRAAPAQASTEKVEARQSDLARFRTDFLARDNSYSTDHRREAEARVARLEEQSGELSDAFFELEIARIVALADNGHTNASGIRRAARYNRVRIRLVPFGTEFRVLRADTAHRDLLGARLVAIDGKPIGEVRAVAHTLFGGTPAFRDRQVPTFLESPEQMEALGVTVARDAATYRFARPDGRTMDRRLDAEAPNQSRERAGTSRWLYPDPLASDQGDWAHVASVDRMPWSLREPDAPFRWRAAPEIDGLVVQFKANRDVPGASIGDFQREVTAEIRRSRPTNIVVDMRANGGGDLNTTRDFMQALPGLVPGRIFALTSPWTFSAAISSVGYLKQAAGDRLTIVGEMVGDRLEFWAEGRPIILPNLDAAISLATERHDYATGCRPYKDCHGSVVRHPISVPSLAPDIDAPMTYEAYVAGTDPGMEAIAAVLRRR